jgi:hypothetical protein
MVQDGILAVVKRKANKRKWRVRESELVRLINKERELVQAWAEMAELYQAELEAGLADDPF